MNRTRHRVAKGLHVLHREREAVWEEERRSRITPLELVAAILLLPFTLTFARVFAQILGF